MPVTVVKKEPKKAVEATKVEGTTGLVEGSTQDLGIAAAIDAIGEIDAKLAVLQADTAKLSAARAEIMQTLKDLGQGSYLGAQHALVVAVKSSKQRSISDKEGLVTHLEAIQEGLAFDLAEFKLGDLDKYIGKEEQSKYITVSTKEAKSFTVKKIGGDL